MSDILVLTESQDSSLLLQALVDKHGLRAKIALDLESCEAWLTARSFSYALLDIRAGIDSIKNLTEKIWEKNKNTRVVVFDLEGGTPLDALLIGVEVIGGQKILPRIEELFEEIRQAKGSIEAQEHLLVVEDLDSPRDIICLFLEGLGYTQITGVSSADEALSLLKNDPQKYTTIITDIRMPQMSGDELIRLIRRTEGINRIPIIALTAYGSPYCFLKCLKAGATGFLVKPPKKPDLKRELERAGRVRVSGGRARLVDEEQVEELYAVLQDKGYMF